MPSFAVEKYFYPRPPRGGRPGLDGAVAGHTVFLSTPSARRATTKERTNARIVEFLSTPSARRATVELTVEQHKPEISIHALREEGDLKIMAITHDPEIFLSTPSARRATRCGIKSIVE